MNAVGWFAAERAARPGSVGDGGIRRAVAVAVGQLRRLTSDLGLNAPGVEIVLRLLDEIEALRAAIERRG